MIDLKTFRKVKKKLLFLKMRTWTCIIDIKLIITFKNKLRMVSVIYFTVEFSFTETVFNIN